MFILSVAETYISFLAGKEQDLVQMSTWVTLLTGCFPFCKKDLLQKDHTICDSQHAVLTWVAPPGKLLAMPIPTSGA